MAEVSVALRELRSALLQVNQSVGERFELGTVEMEFIDLIARLGPLTPGALAKRTGLSPPTVTGICDRLESGGWVRRERDPEDRRRVLVYAEMRRAPELGRRYAGMLTRLHAISEQYTVKELQLLLDFLHKVRDAGEEAVADLLEEE